jgi:hypothetical protein
MPSVHPAAAASILANALVPSLPRSATEVAGLVMRSRTTTRHSYSAVRHRPILLLPLPAKPVPLRDNPLRFVPLPHKHLPPAAALETVLGRNLSPDLAPATPTALPAAAGLTLVNVQVLSWPRSVMEDADLVMRSLTTMQLASFKACSRDGKTYNVSHHSPRHPPAKRPKRGARLLAG